jgi:hypothetical protein
MRERIRRATAAVLVATVLLAAGVAVAGPWSWPTVGRSPALTAFDQVARPGEAVTLTAKIYQPTRLGFHLNLHDRAIRFSCPPLPAWETSSGEDGMATVEVAAPAGVPKIWEYEASYPGSPKHRPARCSGRVFLWHADTPLLVTDVDHTISALHPFHVPFTTNIDTPPLPGSVEALQELAGLYRVVYLTARDESLYDKTRAWLSEKGFPAGPLFCRDMNVFNSSETFKRCFLADLRKRYPYLVAGVGDRLSDARAYRANGMKVVLIDPKGKLECPEGAVVVPSWREAARHLRGLHPGVVPSR